MCQWRSVKKISLGNVHVCCVHGTPGRWSGSDQDPNYKMKWLIIWPATAVCHMAVWDDWRFLSFWNNIYAFYGKSIVVFFPLCHIVLQEGQFTMCRKLPQVLFPFFDLFLSNVPQCFAKVNTIIIRALSIPLSLWETWYLGNCNRYVPQ